MNAVALEHARAAAEAELELSQVRRARLALIERMSSLGGLEAPRHFKTSMEECRWLIAMEKWLDTRQGRRPKKPRLQNPLATMPTQEPERSAEAIRRALPELIKLNRYESRAVARRDRAVRELSKRCIASEETARPDLANAVGLKQAQLGNPEAL